MFVTKRVRNGLSTARRLSAAAALLAAPAAALGGEFDGQWSINATATSALCPVKSKMLVAFVRGGAVSRLSGLPGATAAGGVAGDGAVALSVRVLGHTAQARGRVLGAWGEGVWSSDSLLCGQGNWRAHAER